MMRNERIGSAYSSKRLIVCLTRLQNTEFEHVPAKPQLVLDIQKVVKCPGCSLYLGSEEKCAQHLLQECLLPKNRTDSEAFRDKLIQWLLKYFYTHYTENSPTETKRLVEDELESNYSKLTKFRVCEIQLPRIPLEVQCPVCEKYFWPSRTCFEHLLEDCLFSKNSEDGLCVRDWFSAYLCSNSEEKLDFISSNLQYRNLGKRVVCKYCKKEFLDKDDMFKHLRSSHREEQKTGDSICNFCNFKPGSHRLLIKHVIAKHVRCDCGEKFRTFDMLKVHLNTCPKRSSCVCPMCQEDEMGSYATETDFQKHLENCRRPVPLSLRVEDLYFECDVCFQVLLKCNAGVHVAKHVKFTNSVKRQVRNRCITLDALRDTLSDKDFLKLRTLVPEKEHAG